MANNSVPYEIIAAPYSVWWAPVATAFPDVDTAPAVAWSLVGTSGPLNITDDGVTVEMPQTIEKVRALGDSGTRKVFRIEEDMIIKMMVFDMSIEALQQALNGNAITTTAAASGTPGTKKIGLSRGFDVNTVALLVRGPSPYMSDGALQLEIPRAAQSGSSAVQLNRKAPAALSLEWTALVNPSAANEFERFGVIRAQTAVALP